MKKNTVKLNEAQLRKVVAESVSNTYLEAKRIINGKPFNEVANLPSVDERFSYGTLNGGEGEGLVDLNFKDILVTVRDENGVANIVSYEQYDENNQFNDLIHINEHKQKKAVKLNESQLRKIIAESIKKVLKEDNINGINAGLVGNRRGRLIQVGVAENPTAYELVHSKYMGDFKKRGFDPNLCRDTIYGRGFVFLANKPNAYHIKKYGHTIVTVKIDGEVPVYLSPADGEFIFIPAEEAGRIHQIGISELGGGGSMMSEAKIREIVSESIRKALLGNGKYQDTAVTNQWVGETEPFEAIMNSAQVIMNQFAQYKNAGNQYGPSAQIYQWAKSVYEQANNWLNANMY